MDDLAIRVATRDDGAAILDLCRRSLTADDSSNEIELNRLIWDDPDSGAGMRLVAQVGSEIVGCVLGSVRDYDDNAGLTGFVKLLAVRPDVHRRHVGARMLGGLEQRLAEARVNQIWAGGNQPHYWWPGVDRAYTDAIAFFASAGYIAAGRATNMRVNLIAEGAGRKTDEPSRAWRRLAREEWPQFQTWMRQSWGKAWQEEVELTLDRNPISCFVATEGASFIGFAAYDTNRSGWFGPMGSLVQARGRGIGRGLLRKCLDDYRAKGLTSCAIAWAGPQDFYRRTVGAEPDREFVRMRKTLYAEQIEEACGARC